MRYLRRIGASLIVMAMLAAQFTIVHGADEATVLDLSKGAITISPTGASGGGLDADETELNPAGYIIDGGGSQTGNGITVAANTSTEITLRSVTISGSNIAIKGGATATLILETINIITAPSQKAAISVAPTASLTIRGSGSITVQGGLRAAGIGADYLYDCGDITIHSGRVTAMGGSSGGAGIGGSYGKNITGNINIHGGNVMAQGVGGNAAGIGGGASRTRKNISIFGGTIEAISANTSSGWGIGDGITSQDTTTPVVIDAGSVKGRVQGRPQNSNGTDVYRVESVLESAENSEVTVLDEKGKSWSAMASEGGSLFSYLPKSATLAAAQFGGILYTAEVDVKADDTEKVTLVKYEGDPCVCDNDTADFSLSGEEVTVNKNMGVENVVLDAKFTKADGCNYPIHGGKITYTLSGIDETKARIENGIMTVYTAADGETLAVTASVEIGGKTYTSTADYPITVSDVAEFDLSSGNIVITKNNTVTQGGNTYSDIDDSKVIYIKQSSPTVSNTIKIEDGITRNIVFKGINIEKILGSDSAVNIGIGSTVNLRLEGNNTIAENTDNCPAIRCPSGSSLVIDGSGTLTASGGKNASVIGGIMDGTTGAITVNGGEINVTGSEGGGAAIGSGRNGHGADIVINGGKITATSSYGAAIGNGLSGTGASVTVAGGAVFAEGGNSQNGISGGLKIDGGSVKANGISAEQVNSSGNKVYSTILTVGELGAANVTYKLNDGTEINSATDNDGKLYLFLPNGEWIIVCVSDGTTKYYKRIKPVKEQNSGECVANPEAKLLSFKLPGQLSSSVNEEEHTATVVMSRNAVVSSSNPSLRIVGSQYLPEGAGDFSDAETTPVVYTIIADDGHEQEYNIYIERKDSDSSEPMKLDIGLGAIEIFKNEETGEIEVTLGGSIMPPSESGYIITGETDTNYIMIADDVDFPIIFEDLTISSPKIHDTESGSTEYYSPVYINANAEITIKGRNTLTAGDGMPTISVMYEESYPASLIINGDGGLTLNGGSGAPAIGGGAEDMLGNGSITINGGRIIAKGGAGAAAVGGMDASKRGDFIINGGSVHLIDSGDTSGIVAAPPVAADHSPVYPIEIIVNDGSITDAEVEYTDSTQTAAVKLLTDDSGKLYIYRKTGKYSAEVLYDGIGYYSDGDIEVKDAGVSATVAITSVTGVSFTNSDTFKESTIDFTINGSYLGGEIVVTATSASGAAVSATAVKNSSGKYVASLTIPANNSFDTDAVYTISVVANGVAQTLSPVPKVTKPKRLQISSFKIEGQVGDTVIDEENDTITVYIPYDMTNKVFTPEIEYNAASIAPSGELNFSKSQKYTLDATVTGNGDYREYTVSVLNMATPTAKSLSFTNPADAGKSSVDIRIVGTDLDNAAYAVNHSKDIIVSAEGLTSATAVKKADGSWVATIEVPANTSIIEAKSYALEVTIGGVKQVLTGNRTLTVPRMLDNKAQITRFEIDDQIGESKFEEIGTNSYMITIVVPFEMDLTSVYPYVEVAPSSAEYSPTGAQDFNNPVTYTATAEDGSSRTYKINVIKFTDVELGDITITNPATASGGNAEVLIAAAVSSSVRVQAVDSDGNEIEGTVSKLTPGADTQSGSARVVFELPANTTTISDKEYTLRIWLDGQEQTVPADKKLIVPKHEPIGRAVQKFEVEEQIGESVYTENNADSFNVQVYVPYDADISAFEPVIELMNSEATYEPTGVQDFSSPVEYTVYADGVVQKYLVTVTNFTDVELGDITITNPATAEGGNAEILIAAAVSRSVRAQVIDSDGNEIEGTVSEMTPGVDTQSGSAKVSFELPANTATVSDKEYTLRIWLDGQEQTVPANKKLIVPKHEAIGRIVQRIEVEGQLGESVFTENNADSFDIQMYVPYDADITAVEPVIELKDSEATYEPTGAHDFSSPVEYTVYSDGVVQKYNVAVTNFAEQSIGEITIVNPDSSDGGTAEVTIAAAFSKTVTAKAVDSKGNEIEGVVIEMTPGVDTQSGSVKIIFELPENTGLSSDLEFTLQIWLDEIEQTVSEENVLIVPHRKSRDKYNGLKISSVSIPNMSGRATISGNRIVIKTTGGVKSIEPVFEHTGVAIEPEGPQNFSRPVAYTIYDEKGNPREYKVYIEQVEIRRSSGSSVYVSRSGNSYIEGYSDGTFRPDSPVTRAEAVKILASISSNYYPARTYSQYFTDVDNSEWYANPIGFASQTGIAQGDGDGMFRPNDSITRMEFAAMLSRFGYMTGTGKSQFTDVGEQWGARYINALAEAGILTGYSDGSFRPDEQITRAEAVAAVNRLTGTTITASAAAGTDLRFTDVPRSHWAYLHIMAAALGRISE